MKTTSSEVNRGGAASQPAGEAAHRYLRAVEYGPRSHQLIGMVPTISVNEGDSGYDILFVSLGTPDMMGKAKSTMAKLNSHAALVEALEFYANRRHESEVIADDDRDENGAYGAVARASLAGEAPRNLGEENRKLREALEACLASARFESKASLAAVGKARAALALAKSSQ